MGTEYGSGPEMTPKGFSYSFSWTEQNRGTFGYRPFDYTELHALETPVETIRLDTIDKIVEGMTEFPEVEKLLEKIYG